MATTATYPLIKATQPPAIGPGLAYVADHRGEAEGRLLAQFDDAAKLHALVRALVGPLQTLEQAAFEVLGAFEVDSVAGAQLDAVGGLVGESRQSRGDAHYRAYVKARILANSADGRPSVLYDIARALLGEDVLSLRLRTMPPAHYDFEVAASALQLPWDDAQDVPEELVARALADALFMATSAGVSLTVFYQYTADADTFLFASGDVEEADAARGLADDELTDAGGALIGAEDRS
jgi:hypothetical protein